MKNKLFVLKFELLLNIDGFSIDFYLFVILL